MISLILATALTCQLCGDTRSMMEATNSESGCQIYHGTRSMMEATMNETAYELSMLAKQEAKLEAERQANFVGPPPPPVVQPPTKRLSRAQRVTELQKRRKTKRTDR